MEVKGYTNIQAINYGNEFEKSNTKGFEVGDIIQITEKVDGSNASIRYDSETGKLECFSRRYQLKYDLTLSGFWHYVQGLNPDDYKDTSNYIIFGEWTGIRNAITYNPESCGKWYVFDIFDIETGHYLSQSEVKKFAKEHRLTYVHVLYEGEFISWEHCKSFSTKSAYGDTIEGIVVKNQTKLYDTNKKGPSVLKIVNEGFSEIKKGQSKNDDNLERAKAIEQAQNVVDMVVTKRRVEKELHKMRDDGILPEQITPKHMGLIAKILPSRIYDDCVKEAKELVMSGGEQFGKVCKSKTMDYAREIILGSK